MEVFIHGFQAASVEQIVEKTGLTKGAFFHHFPTKNDLGYALVDETLAQMTRDRWIHPLDRYKNPLQGIAENLKNIIDDMPEKSLSLGCPLNNLVQEMSNLDPIFRRKLGDVLEIWIGGLESHLKRAKRKGLLREGVSVRRLAEFIVMNHEGAFGIIKAISDRSVFRSLHASLKTYLQTVSTVHF